MTRLIRQAAERAGLGPEDGISSGVDVIGSLGVVRLRHIGSRRKKRFGEALLQEVPNLVGVFEQDGKVEGDFRLRPLKHLAGRTETLTIHKENGCVFKVDISKCYFSPRLSTERLRVADATRKGEKVLNMFAGVGPFSIPIAKMKGAKVTSCELNAYACGLHVENNRLNKVGGLVDVVNSDAAELPLRTKSRFDRVLMPHPSEADKFLDVALSLAAKRAKIIYYRHLLARNDEEGKAAMAKDLSGRLPRGARIAIRRVRVVGPRWMEMVAEIRLPA